MHERRVRRLALRAPTEALARRTAIALEDALHTASLPGGDSARLVVIRRLALGRIPAHLSPAQLALAIERRVWELRAAGVHALDESAAGASVVFFQDAAEPYVLLARRLARGQPATEWYWRAAVRGWRPGAVPDAWRELLAGVARLEGAPAVVVRIVRALLEDRTCDALCAAMHQEDGTSWLQWLGWSRPAPARDTSPRAGDGAAVTPLALVVLRKWAMTWGPGDDRTLWLASAVLVAERRAHVADPHVTARAARAIALVTASASPRHAAQESSGSLPADAADPGGAREAAVERVRRAGDIDRHETERRHGEQTVGGLEGPPPTHDPSRAEEPPAILPLPDGVVTPYAGLFFSVQLLNRLGIAAALDEHPDWLAADVPARILNRVAACAGIPEGDTVMQVPAMRPRPPAADDQAIDTVVAHWVAGMRRWCWRYPRIRLRSLVATPGRVSATDTHVDLWFDLRQSDVRVRRAGLDLDPGWVPWLGCVVRFHYGA